MIDEAIYTAIKDTGIDAALIHEAQIVEPPFAVFKVSTEPRRTKDGVVGYTSLLQVINIDNTVAPVRTKATEIIAALVALSETTASDTEIESVMLLAREPDYEPGDADGEHSYFLETLDFKIQHTNE